MHQFELFSYFAAFWFENDDGHREQPIERTHQEPLRLFGIKKMAKTIRALTGSKR
jgi:hypothetical protein